MENKYLYWVNIGDYNFRRIEIKNKRIYTLICAENNVLSTFIDLLLKYKENNEKNNY